MAKFDPKKVGADADQLIKDLQAQQAAQDTPPADPPPTPDEPKVAAVADATPAVTTPAPAPSADIDMLKQQLSEADQRWKTLQGMLAKRDAELDQMRQLIAQLQAAPPKAPEKPTPFVTKADEDAFGADMIDLNRRVAREEVTNEVSQLKQYIAKLEDRLGIVSQATVQTNQARFEERLAGVVPNWVQINEDPNFIAWLGKYKLTALRAAYQEFDVDGVASFFTDYMKTVAPPAASVSQPTAEDIVAPGKGTGATPTPSVQQEHVWTRSDIAQLYRDKQEGRISDADFKKAEAEIFKQANAGKIAA